MKESRKIKRKVKGEGLKGCGGGLKRGVSLSPPLSLSTLFLPLLSNFHFPPLLSNFHFPPRSFHSYPSSLFPFSSPLNFFFTFSSSSLLLSPLSTLLLNLPFLNLLFFSLPPPPSFLLTPIYLQIPNPYTLLFFPPPPPFSLFPPPFFFSSFLYLSLFFPTYLLTSPSPSTLILSSSQPQLLLLTPPLFLLYLLTFPPFSSFFPIYPTYLNSLTTKLTFPFPSLLSFLTF